MKRNTIKLLVLILCFLFSVNTFSQFKRIGVRAGVNLSNVRITNSDFSQLMDQSKFLNTVGFNIGFLTQSSKNNIFATDFGFFYSLKGCKDDSYNLRFNTLQIPLVFKINIPIAKPVALQGGFGPYLAYTFLAKEEIDGVSNEDILSWAAKFEDSFFGGKPKQYNPWDAGIIFGGDITIDLPNDCVLEVGCNYELGIMKVSNEWEIVEDNYINPGLKNNNITINLSYLFNVKKNKS